MHDGKVRLGFSVFGRLNALARVWVKDPVAVPDANFALTLLL